MDVSKPFAFQEVLETSSSGPVSFIIDWTIPDFSFFKAVTDPISSRERVLGKSVWRLVLYPLKKPGEANSLITVDSVGLFVQHTHSAEGSFAVRMNGKLGVVGGDGKFLAGMHLADLEFTYTRTSTAAYGSPGMVPHSRLWGPNGTVLVDGALKVRADIKYLSLDVITSPSDRLELRTLNTHSSIQQDYQSLYETAVGRDFVLVSSDGIELPVHRAVLMARSPVFLGMFESNMAETQTGRCVISDINSSVLTALVKFMYCGFSEQDIKADPCGVLVAADKYQVAELVKRCEQFLVEQLAVDNVVDLVLLTDGVGAPALRNAGLRFVRNNYAALKGSGAIKMLMEKASAELVDEVMGFLVPS